MVHPAKPKKFHIIEWEIKNYDLSAIRTQFTELLLNASSMKESAEVIAKAMGK